MLLIYTNSEDKTSDYLAKKLHAQKIPFVRLDTDTVAHQAKFEYDGFEVGMNLQGKKISARDFKHVYLRRPESLSLMGELPKSESQKFRLKETAVALEGFLAQIPPSKWINFPANNALASNKLSQLTRAKKLGLKVPLTFVGQSIGGVKAFFRKVNGSMIAKPLFAGYVEGKAPSDDRLVYTNEVRSISGKDKASLEECPTLFQQKISKSADVRVNYLDGKVIAVFMARKASNGTQVLDIRANNMVGVSYTLGQVPRAVAVRVRKLMNHFQLRFGALDFVVDKAGQWYFLEINPSGQWAWLDIVAGLEVHKLFTSVFSRGR